MGILTGKKSWMFIAVWFVASIGFWLLYEKLGIMIALLPISIPAYVSLSFFGEGEFVVIGLLLVYAVLICVGVELVRKYAAAKYILLLLLIGAHIFCYRYTVNSLEQMGQGIVGQMTGS